MGHLNVNIALACSSTPPFRHLSPIGVVGVRFRPLPVHANVEGFRIWYLRPLGHASGPTLSTEYAPALCLSPLAFGTCGYRDRRDLRCPVGGQSVARGSQGQGVRCEGCFGILRMGSSTSACAYLRFRKLLPFSRRLLVLTNMHLSRIMMVTTPWVAIKIST